SRNIGNLFFAGRNFSATHAANSSTRVMATCSLLGQAMGTAAGMCVNYGLTPRQIFTEGKVPELQAKLMDAGCYLPWHTREIPAISREAKLNLSEEQKALLHNGIERTDKNNTINYVTLNIGDEITYDFGKPTALHELRLMFDPDFSRKSISKNVKMRTFAQRSSIGFDFDGVHIAKTLVKDFEVYMDDKLVFSTDNNYHSLVRLPLEGTASKLTVKFLATRGEETVHVFSCDVK
ncbi:MAG: FAD-dependent oxidoreductase, partial [Clostridia bacterium]|nr:FAD-dependent oxidoreductase [Clostridia bacterium]